MNNYSRRYMPDRALVNQARANAARERGVTAELLADIAEIDARRLYAEDACPSLFAWCVRELHLSEDAAYKRMQAARAAGRHALLFGAVADGRLHLTAVVMLAPHLTSANVDDLVAAAAHKSKAAIETLLAERFPRPDLPTLVRLLAPAPASVTLPVAADCASRAAQSPSADNHSTQLVPEPVRTQESQHVTPPVAVAAPERTRPTPLAPSRYGLQFTVGQEAFEDLQAVQALLGHAVAPGDVAAVFARAVHLLREHLERRRCAATTRPRPARRSSDPRRIPAAVRREVWRRDRGRCTFVGSNGQRCEARASLELDHVTPVARGGDSRPSNLRLRCRTHNQFEAERAYGKAFMDAKREAARRRKDQAVARKGDGTDASRTG